MAGDFNKIQMIAAGENKGTISPFAFASQSERKINLPPIGVFWDLENCHVPKNKSGFDVVRSIRENYFEGHREAEFICVCDVNKESKERLAELNNAQVVVVHIESLCKNAADIKLRQCMQKFADIHATPATIILISGDVNFAPDLSDLRYRRQFNIILIHNGMANVGLVACAHFSISLVELTRDIPNRCKSHKTPQLFFKLIVSNLPLNCGIKQISQRLQRLSDNCGGKIESISGNRAVLIFSSPELALRARKRMDNEDVFGNQISVNCLSNDELSKKNSGQSKDKQLFPPPPSAFRPRAPLLYTESKSLSQDKSTSIGSLRCLTISDSINLQHEDSNQIGSKMNGYNGHGSAHHGSDGRRDVTNSLYPWGKDKGKIALSTRNKFSDGSMHMKDAESSTFSAKAVGSTNQKDFLSVNRGWISGSSGNRRTPSPNFESNGHVASSNGVAKFEGSSLLGESESPVELQIANLDPNIDVKHLKQHLLSLFGEHVMVLHVHVSLNNDGNVSAGIKVPSMNEAQYAISKLHRTRLGSKRISISIASNVDIVPLNVLRSEIIALLLDVPGKRLALFKFRELYEKRYHRSIGISELHRLKDIIFLQENANGKTVVLNPEFRRNTPSPACSDGSKEVQEILEMAHCEMHSVIDDGKGWAEKEQATQLPSVIISLETLTTNIHNLLQLHGNGIPLNSLPTCYQCVFGSFNNVDTGVPLEHLVTIVPGVQIARNLNGIKILDWVNDKGSDYNVESRSISPPLANQLSLLCREIVDLLKNQSQCRIPFTKFIPAYHHHFGRQCRVADYGYTRLLDLLEAIPHVIQILGDGNKRILTLTHRAQIKRFNADLLRILKSQVSKEVSLMDFPEIYLKCIGKDFNIVNYGICDIMDMLSEISEGVIVVTGNGEDMKIQLPKREQTVEETERTKQFKLEAMELLRNSPRCRMGFTKFIPSYHHHFSKQCRVSDYGFTKLIELFEAIPDIVEVKQGEEDSEDRVLQLAQPQILEVFSDQVTSLMKVPGRQIMTLEKLLKAYIQQNGYSVYPEDYNVADIVELLEKVDTLKVTEAPGGIIVTLAEKNYNLHLPFCVKKILLSRPNGKLSFQEFLRHLELDYGQACSIQQIRATVGNLIKVEGSSDNLVVQIDSLQMLMRDVVQLLQGNGGRILLANFDEAFTARYKRPCVPAQFGYTSLASLLQSIQDVAMFKGRSTKRALVLNVENANVLNIYGERNLGTYYSNNGLPMQNQTNLGASKSDETSPAKIIDLMNDPIPLRIPSPALRPQPVFETNQLIRFDSPISHDNEINGFDNLLSVMNGHETLSLGNLAKHEKDSFYVSPLNSLPLFQTCFSPASSLLPSVPTSWTSSISSSPPKSFVSALGMAADFTPGTPTASFSDFSVMNTPPYIRELIGNSSPEATPNKTPSTSKNVPRIAAQFTIPLTSFPNSSTYQ